MKETAAEWLFKQLWETPKDKFTWYAILEQAKEMEKEQIIDAYRHGFTEGTCFGSTTIYKFITAEEYYTSTYGRKS
jgi:hypothetical protein